MQPGITLVKSDAKPGAHARCAPSLTNVRPLPRHHALSTAAAAAVAAVAAAVTDALQCCSVAGTYNIIITINFFVVVAEITGVSDGSDLGLSAARVCVDPPDVVFVLDHRNSRLNAEP